MNNIQKRFILFLVGCIGFRLFITYLAKISNKQFLRYMGYVSVLIGIGFLAIYFAGLRKTGHETFGDKIWWNNLRPVHGILYLLFAYNAIIGNRNAWVFLAVDIVLGLISFLWFHKWNGDFNRLL